VLLGLQTALVRGGGPFRLLLRICLIGCLRDVFSQEHMEFFQSNLWGLTGVSMVGNTL